MRTILAVLFCALLCAFLTPTVAKADLFTFSFTGPIDSGSGSFTATPDGTPGQYTIDLGSLMGSVDGNTITALLPPDGYEGNDNLVDYPAGLFSENPNQSTTPDAYLDLNGFSFVAGGMDYNLFFGQAVSTGPFAYYLDYGPFDPSTGLPANTDELTSFTISPTPEPGTLMLLGTGGLSLLGMLRRRIPA